MVLRTPRGCSPFIAVVFNVVPAVFAYRYLADRNGGAARPRTKIATGT